MLTIKKHSGNIQGLTLQKKCMLNQNPVPIKITIDKDKHLVITDNNEFSLPKKEFQINDLLCSITGKVYSRNAIIENIWDNKFKSNERTVDVHILYLKRKLGKELIQTIKGVGNKCYY